MILGEEIYFWGVSLSRDRNYCDKYSRGIEDPNPNQNE